MTDEINKNYFVPNICDLLQTDLSFFENFYGNVSKNLKSQQGTVVDKDSDSLLSLEGY